MASRTVKMNEIEDKIEILNADLKEIKEVLPQNTFDVVTSNPPYMHSEGVKNPNDKKMISRHEVKCNLDDVIKAASILLKERGKFFVYAQ